MPTPIHEEAALASLAKKLCLVTDRVTAVVTGHSTGLYLWGTGGIGKTFTVLKRLEAMEASHRVFNSRMTARGLYGALERAPDVVHILEDMERLTKDRDAQGVLRSALWAQPGHDRVVTWTTATSGEERFAFRGGIIMLANRPLATLPELKALATRIAVHRLDIAEAEAVALMRRLAEDGYRIDRKLALDSATCAEVTEYLIRECQATGCPLDLRLQVNSYRDRMLWEANQAQCDWKDLVASRVREAAHHFREPVNTLSREERQAHQRRAVREICQATGDAEEQVRRFKEQTGMSRATYFRRKQEVDSGEFNDPET